MSTFSNCTIEGSCQIFPCESGMDLPFLFEPDTCCSDIFQQLLRYDPDFSVPCRLRLICETAAMRLLSRPLHWALHWFVAEKLCMRSTPLGSSKSLLNQDLRIDSGNHSDGSGLCANYVQIKGRISSFFSARPSTKKPIVSAKVKWNQAEPVQRYSKVVMGILSLEVSIDSGGGAWVFLSPGFKWF